MRLFYRKSYRVFWVLLKLYGASYCILGIYYYFAKHFPPQTPSSHTQACFRREKRAAGVNPFSDFKVSPFAAPPPPSPFTPSWGRKGKEEGALQKGRILELLRSEVQIVHIDDREGGGPRPEDQARKTKPSGPSTEDQAQTTKPIQLFIQLYIQLYLQYSIANTNVYAIVFTIIYTIVYTSVYTIEYTIVYTIVYIVLYRPL